MFSIINFCQISRNSLVRIKSNTNSLINKTTIRWKRNTFSRRPIKILTDSGEDYQKHYSYREPISSAEHEINLNDLKDYEPLDQYFDEGISDHFNRKFDTNRRNLKNNEEFDQKRVDFKNEDNKRDFTSDQKNSHKTKSQPKYSFKEKTVKELKPRIDGIPVYEKLSDNNREFASLMSNMKMRKRREKTCLMALEGKRLICDAIDAGIDLKTIYFTKEENLVGIKDLSLLVSKGLKLKKILYRDMKLFSDVFMCPGIMAICERPKNSRIFANPLYNEQKLPLILIGDNIRDPGNLGTMIRCAAAVGIEKFILTKGCVDVWDSKVLRAGAGAHFRLPIISDIEWPLIFNHIPVNEPFDLFIAESNQEFDRNPLNRTIKKPFTETDIPLHTINTITKDIDPKTNETILCDNSYEDIDNQLIKYRNSSIGLNTYSDAKFYTLGIQRKSVLVIGGEAHGLSNQSYKLAYDYIGRRIKIPLAFGVDSLNSAVAAAVILYEMKRQFLSICGAADNQNIQQNI